MDGWFEKKDRWMDGLNIKMDGWIEDENECID